MSQRPVVIGLLFCEQVIVEEHTRNVTFVNSFSVRRVKRIPTEPLSFSVVANLTDGSGTVRMTARMEALETGGIIFERTRDVLFKKPLAELRFTLSLRGISFPAAGSYDIVLLADGEAIAQKKLEIILKEN